MITTSSSKESISYFFRNQFEVSEMSEDVKQIYEKFKSEEILYKGKVTVDYRHPSYYIKRLPEDQTSQNFWCERGIRRKMDISEITDELNLPLNLQINKIDIPFGRESILMISPRTKGFDYIFINTKDIEYIGKIKEIMKEKGYVHSPFLEIG
jgi:hypothetical protein